MKQASSKRQKEGQLLLGFRKKLGRLVKPIVCKEFFSMYLTTLVRGMAKLGR